MNNLSVRHMMFSYHNHQPEGTLLHLTAITIFVYVHRIPYDVVNTGIDISKLRKPMLFRAIQGQPVTWDSWADIAGSFWQLSQILFWCYILTVMVKSNLNVSGTNSVTIFTFLSLITQTFFYLKDFLFQANCVALHTCNKYGCTPCNNFRQKHLQPGYIVASMK